MKSIYEDINRGKKDFIDKKYKKLWIIYCLAGRRN